MSKCKNKNFVFSERVKLLERSRSSIYYELKHYTKETVPASVRFNRGKARQDCEILKRFPFVCNGCANTRCSHRSRFYSAYEAQRKAEKLLRESRSDTERRKETVRILKELPK